MATEIKRGLCFHLANCDMLKVEENQIVPPKYAFVHGVNQETNLALVFAFSRYKIKEHNDHKRYWVLVDKEHYPSAFKPDGVLTEDSRLLVGDPRVGPLYKKIKTDVEWFSQGHETETPAAHMNSSEAATLARAVEQEYARFIKDYPQFKN